MNARRKALCCGSVSIRIVLLRPVRLEVSMQAMTGYVGPEADAWSFYIFQAAAAAVRP